MSNGSEHLPEVCVDFRFSDTYTTQEAVLITGFRLPDPEPWDTRQVRDRIVWSGVLRGTAKVDRERFDRWLAAHDAEQRSRIAALEAVIREVRSLVMSTDGDYIDGDSFDGLAGLIQGAIALAPSVVLDGMIREAKAEAWDEGAAANWDGQDLRHPNPYRNGDA